ncbi:MAG TPA: hypothetical protein DD473_06715 [Planctomycetaceae bacterium]|nr:hypothetical protein [Planctomycetaceae bacterium]
MSKQNSDKKLLKFYLKPEQHDLIRLASAIHRTTMAQFSRKAVIAAAEQANASFYRSRSQTEITSNESVPKQKQ